MSSGLKSGLVLLVLGVICGTLLAFVNSLTAPIIEQKELNKKFEVLGEFYDLEQYDWDEITDVSDDISSIFTFKQDGELIGLVYQVAATGYNGPVTMLIAVNSDYSIQGYTVISNTEDAGFGADIINNDFNVTSIVDLSEFDAVAGVTFTSNAIRECFTIVSERAGTDFGGGLND